MFLNSVKTDGLTDNKYPRREWNWNKLSLQNLSQDDKDLQIYDMCQLSSIFQSYCYIQQSRKKVTKEFKDLVSRLKQQIKRQLRYIKNKR